MGKKHSGGGDKRFRGGKFQNRKKKGGSLQMRSVELKRASAAKKKAQERKTKVEQELSERRQKRKIDQAKIPYSPSDRILLIGEGNFSFSCALAELLCAQPPANPSHPRKHASNVVATCYDTESDLHSKYDDAHTMLNSLASRDVSVVTAVDASHLREHAGLYHVAMRRFSDHDMDSDEYLSSEDEEAESGDHSNESSRKPVKRPRLEAAPVSVSKWGEHEPRIHGFDKIVFNFPHTGCGIKDTAENNRIHQQFLTTFLLSASSLLRVRTGDDEDAEPLAVTPDSGSASSGFHPKRSAPDTLPTPLPYARPEIHLTLKRGLPYSEWGVMKSARATGLLELKSAHEFLPEVYPGYEHRRTAGAVEQAHNHAAATPHWKALKPNEDIVRAGGAVTYIFVPKDEAMEVWRQERVAAEREQGLARKAAGFQWNG